MVLNKPPSPPHPPRSLSPQPCHQPTPAAFADQDRDRRDAPAHRPRLVQGGGGGHRRLAAKDQRRLQQSRAAAAAQQAVADQEVARADDGAAAALQCPVPRPATPSPPPSLLPPSLTSHRQLPPFSPLPPPRPPPPLPDFAPLERRPNTHLPRCGSPACHHVPLFGGGQAADDAVGPWWRGVPAIALPNLRLDGLLWGGGGR